MLGHGVSFANAVVTCSCSFLSLLGSIFIILSYALVSTKNTPKSAFLIVHLAVSDFFWFLAAAVLSSIWLTGNGDVPDAICYLTSPVIIFTRMASLFWTVVISFNVLMSVQKRKWFYKSQEKDWNEYRWRYYAIICFFALPGMFMGMAKQYASTKNAQLGCSARYEPLGVWYEVFFTEALPILFAFVCNIYVFVSVRVKMSNAPVPQSVRKRRKRVMYYYVMICILCWIPTIVLYLLEMSGLHYPALEIVARTSLYLSGFFNFLVFGMQDPHLYRSFFVMMRAVGLEGLCFSSHLSTLKAGDVDKSVMFQEEALQKGSDRKGSKRDQYMRSRKLSKEDKEVLYSERPDLDPAFRITRYNSRKKKAVRMDSGTSSEGSGSGQEDVEVQQHLLDPADTPSDSSAAPSPAPPARRAHSSSGFAMRQAAPAASPRTAPTISRYSGSGKMDYFRVSGQSDSMNEDGDTVNQLHVALLSEITTDPEQSASFVRNHGPAANAGDDLEAGPAHADDSEEEQEQPPIPDYGDAAVPVVAGAGAGRQRQRQGAGNEDDSSDDEIDAEDEALMAVLYPQ